MKNIPCNPYYISVRVNQRRKYTQKGQTGMVGTSDDSGLIRIGFLIAHLKPGGIETLVLNIISNLDYSRFTPILILKSKTGNLLEKVPPHIEIVDLEGKRAILLPFSLARIYAKLDLDVVYSGTNAMNVASLLSGYIIKNRKRPKLIISEHTSARTYLAESKYPTLRKLLLRWLYPKADYISAPIAEILHEWSAELRADCINQFILPNPVIPESSFPTVQARSKPDPVHLISAGRLVKAKGHDVAILAFRKFVDIYPDAKFTIFGEGEKRDSLQSLINDQGLSENVCLYGYTDNLLGELSKADIFILASRREGFGNVIIEALASGTPLIASDCIGPNIILNKKELGYIVPVEDVEALFDATCKLMESLPISNDMARRLQDRAAQFTVEKSVDCFQNFISKIK